MKHWKRKAGALLLSLALVVSNQSSLFSLAAEVAEVEETETIEKTDSVETESTGGTEEEGSESAAAETSEETKETESQDSVETKESATETVTEEATESVTGTETETEEETETATETESETETEAESETETETETEAAAAKGAQAPATEKEAYTTEIEITSAEGVTVYVSAEVPAGAFEGDVELSAEVVSAEKMNEVMNSVAEALEGTGIAGAYVVDISFQDENGEKVSPDGSVSVTVRTDAADIGILDTTEKSKLKSTVYHVEEGKATDIGGKVELDESNRFVGMSFTSDSFSPFAAVVLDVPTTLAEGAVCKIGEQEYGSLDEAIADAKDGDTIELLRDCTITKGFDKSIVFDGGSDKYKISSDGVLYSFNKEITFRNCVVSFFNTNTGTGSYAGTINVGTDGIITLDNANVVMDGTNENGNRHGIYFWNGANRETHLILRNNSELKIMNYPQDALEWDDGSGYFIEMYDSKYISDHNRSGFTGTFTVKAENSEIDVINSTGNGSNGSNYEFSNSIVNFNNNGSHGLSAGRLTIDHSVVTARGNGGNGIHTNSTLTIQNNSEVIIEENACSISSQWTIPGALHVGGGESSIDATSTLTIQNNNGSGIFLKSGELEIAEGADITIVKNTAEKLGLGGGVHVNSDANLILPSGAVLYNNHAATAGDDIYVNKNATITFGEVDPGKKDEAGNTEGWWLDGAPDCEDAIDGWYEDTETRLGSSTESGRWKAHGDKPYYTKLFTDRLAVSGELALKAAHGMTPVKPDDPDIPEWMRSKSKTATNLDENYDSEVTLSLPAADYKPSIDVVFVIDDTHAGKEIFTEPAKKLLDELRSKKNLSINLGIVTFDAVARDWISVTSDGQYSGLVSIQDENAAAAIENALQEELTYEGEGQRKKVGATNLEWPLEMAEQMLDGGQGTEKHVILFSDMYGYVYRGSLTIDGVTYENVPVGKRLYKDMAKMSTGTKYNNFADVLENRADADQLGDSFFRDSSWNSYWENYSEADTPGLPENPYIVPQSSYSSYETSCCLTYDRILSLAEKAHVTIVNNDFDPEPGSTPYARDIKDEMLDTLKSVAKVNVIKTTQNPDASEIGKVFDSLKDELIQLVDSGSTVKDVIGYGKDDKGNDYDFDFINDIDRLTLKVGDTELAKTSIDETTYGFGASDGSKDKTTYPFVLHYYKNGTDGKSDECFIWDINTPITIDETVQLTYTVHLNNPQTAEGTYGIFDADGKQNDGETGSLFTNRSAVLNPVDSTGEMGMPEEFYKPTVSYSVMDIAGQKKWDDADNQDGKRPSSITVKLLADGVEVASKEVTAADNWAYSFEGLRTDGAGTEISYSIVENAVPNYSTSYEGYDVINTYTPGKTSISVTKAWDDENDQDKLRPTSVVVKLLADGKETGKTLTLSGENGWKGSFAELDEYADGKAVVYTVAEANVPEGYTCEITGDAAKGYVITNTHAPKASEQEEEKPGNDPGDSDSDSDSSPDPVYPVTPAQPVVTAPADPAAAVPESPAAPAPTGAATGDSTPIAVWLVLVLMAAAALIGLIYYKNQSVRRKKKR